MQWLETNSSELLAFKIKIGKEDFLFANVYMREERNKNYEKMALYIDEFKACSIIIGEDFNARISNKEGKIEGLEEKDESRKTRDKVLNDEGKVMLR